eukprot:gnl/MRDRNA2_/MRDRNA2_109896_c0_seq1.p1 gnl/MRDRNA2_/MRDRNA2_109896_c0~~gnl/MRDRNA2_/MRDRNA2_109896_c0_seq1.p1  ORF type:complete len:482 (+),score=108.43 gnl/MRDRNA2_/MRDRNA2_109896_c0_seq1:165-1610(+)
MLSFSCMPGFFVVVSIFTTTDAFLRTSRSASATNVAEKSRGFFFDYHLHGQDWHDGFCESRERQSPIDFDRFAPWDCQAGLTPPLACDKGPLQFTYEQILKGFTLQNNGKSLAADFVAQGYGGITYNNKWFNLLSVNFHSGSEHTFHGRRYPLALHFVHKQYDSGHVIVVAVPFDTPGAAEQYSLANPGAPALLQQQKRQPQPQYGFLRTTAAEAAVQEKEDSADEADVARAIRDRNIKKIISLKEDAGFNPHLEVFLSQGLPAKGSRMTVNVQTPTDILNPFLQGGTYFEYRGSLTAPPCAEQTTWMVRREPLMASDHQADLIHDNIYKANMDYGNYRSAMPLMGREIFVRTGVQAEPAATADFKATFQANETRASDFGAIAHGRLAHQAAKEAGTMARAIDDTLARAAQAHANQLPASDIFLPPPAVHEIETVPTPDPHKLLTSIANNVAAQAADAMSNAVVAAAAAVPTVPPLAPPPM